MLDNQLFTLIFSIVNAGLAAQSITGVTVSKAYNSITVGVPSGASVSCFKISDHRYGYPKKVSTWRPEEPPAMLHTTTQCYETNFQMQALIPLDATPADAQTASDLVNIVAAIMQDDTAIATLKLSEVQILRITDVRNPAFKDEKNRNEFAPSFDFTLTHKQVFTVEVPVIESVQSGIYGI